MATQGKLGWIWTDDEKNWIKQYQPQLRREYRAIRRKLKNVYGALLELDGRARGRKHQPISPDQARELLALLPEKTRFWLALARRHDVKAAGQATERMRRRRKVPSKAGPSTSPRVLEALLNDLVGTGEDAGSAPMPPKEKAINASSLL